MQRKGFGNLKLAPFCQHSERICVKKTHILLLVSRYVNRYKCIKWIIKLEGGQSVTIQDESNRFAITSGDHLLSVRNRKRIDMTAVKSIERFDQEEFYIKTSQGFLLVRGEEMRIVHLDVDKGLLTLEGTIKQINYEEDDEGGQGKGILQKLFG